MWSSAAKAGSTTGACVSPLFSSITTEPFTIHLGFGATARGSKSSHILTHSLTARLRSMYWRSGSVCWSLVSGLCDAKAALQALVRALFGLEWLCDVRLVEAAVRRIVILAVF
jgi:hypothetical protein